MTSSDDRQGERDREYVRSLSKAVVRHVAENEAANGWLTPEQAAARLQISRRSLERLMEDTPASVRKPWRKIGRTVRWQRDEIDQWVDALHKVKERRGKRR